MNKTVLKKYYDILNELSRLQEYQKILPAGSIRTKIISGKGYYYLQFRDGKTVKSQYVKASDLPALAEKLEESKKMKAEIQKITKEKRNFERLLGIHSNYRPVKNVDYQEYTLFISSVAHDFKRLGTDGFLAEYDPSKYRGVNKRYLIGFMDYISGIERINYRKTNDLVLDPYSYQMYFKYGDKSVIEKELKKAIPAFLNQGLLVTTLQEAVHATSDKSGISEQSKHR